MHKSVFDNLTSLYPLLIKIGKVVKKRFNQLISWFIIAIIFVNLANYLFELGNRENSIRSKSTQDQLYLIDQASIYIQDIALFEQKVRTISHNLGIASEWLMAVMYAESRFKSEVKNQKGSGAIGLIQFMPQTAKELETTPEKLRLMDPINQLDYVYLYFKQVKSRYGSFQSLTDLYLAVLYPKALHQGYCFALYYRPSHHYTQNKGLDKDEDGVVTIGDIDRYLCEQYPTAYIARRGEGTLASNIATTVSF